MEVNKLYDSLMPSIFNNLKLYKFHFWFIGYNIFYAFYTFFNIVVLSIKK